MDQVEKVKIKMLRNSRGSEDGLSVRHFEKDEEAMVGKALAKALIAEGSAEKIGKADPEPEQKAVETAPENKAVFRTAENKAKA